MYRTIYEQLKKWKNHARRKPLMLYGARQVGKTYILKEFGEKEYDNLVYVNCYRNEVISSLFDGDANVGRLVLGLSAYAGQNVVPGKTLIFLDEVQEIPHVVSSLKYFCEDAPDIHIVVAGSLLGVMNMHGESFPVGKVNIMHLYPMSFVEFVRATGNDALAELVEKEDFDMIRTFHERLVDLLRQYYFTGGMPEAVRVFAETRDIQEVRKVQNDILEAYETDISKHAGIETQRIRMVWNSIPAQLARENKKFIYGSVRKSARAKDFEVAIQWLVDAGLVYKVDRVREVCIPLKAYADNGAFKLYMSDVGLLGAASSAPADQILIGNNGFVEYKGALSENYVLQQIVSQDDIPAFYFSKDNSTLEIDFLLQKGGRILPVEVKAEENVKSKSLSSFINNECKSSGVTGVRFSMKGYADQGWMVNVPLYMAGTYMMNVK